MRLSKNPVVTAVVLVSHGSKAKNFDRAMKRIAGDLRRSLKTDVRCAYLEINSPSIPEAIAKAASDGANDIRVLPYFVLLGRHMRKDILSIIRKEKKRHKTRIDITLCPYLGYDKRIAAVALDRVGAVR